MATMTVSLPDPMKDWIEAQIALGDYASVSDYVRDGFPFALEQSLRPHPGQDHDQCPPF